MPLKFYANQNGTVDILAKQGEYWEFTLTVTDRTDVPLDLTDYNVRGQIKQKYTDETSVLDFTCEITDATNGRIRIYSMPENTSQIQGFFTSADGFDISNLFEGIQGVYVYDIKIYAPDNIRVIRILEGKLVVDPEVTKDE